ncbi:MAG: DsbA family protein [Mycobacteriaceae bacterium]|nr:DsbA family protein [Mycobacteriaceae bacterium]MBV9640459.1 DsbA family protein [Mycobacteriaceae bacterium]
MATKPKRYDLTAADRKRNWLVQGGLAAVVVIFAVALVLYIVVSHEKKAGPGQDKAIRVTSSKLITKPGTSEPKAVLSLYEDFLCPACANFEKNFGSTVNNLIDSGAVAADYHMVAILDRPQTQNYSSRAGAAAYCVADQSIDAFRRFHAALFSPQIQPREDASTFPDNKQLVELARQAGAGGNVADCINGGKYTSLVKGIAAAAKVQATPTIRINGQDYDPTTPQDMVNKIESIVGTVPGLTAGAPANAAS